MRGPKVFVVEDDAIILMALQSMLEELGCEVSGRATSLDGGVRLAATVEADLAIVDLSLAGRTARPVIDVLARRGIPVIASRGYDLAGTAGIVNGIALRGTLQKPYTLGQLEAALKAALDSEAAAAAPVMPAAGGG